MNLRDGGRFVRGGEKDLVSQAVDSTSAGFASLGLGSGMRGEGAAVSNGKTVMRDGTKQGSWHKVYTAVAVLAPLESARDPGYAMETQVEETGVKFDPSCEFLSVRASKVAS